MSSYIPHSYTATKQDQENNSNVQETNSPEKSNEHYGQLLTNAFTGLKDLGMQYFNEMIAAAPKTGISVLLFWKAFKHEI